MPADLRQGRLLLQTKRFAEAKHLFTIYLQQHGQDVQAQLGLGDAELGLHDYLDAEKLYRAVLAQQPELWQAHKNLVVVEAELGRWEDFEGERRILQLARERNAPGLSTRESDVIDSFDLGGEHWVVRAYFEPEGRSGAIYNFEGFSAAGRLVTYLSLEDAAKAQAALQPGDVRIGGAAAAALPGTALALNWYTGSAHGRIALYSKGDPGYRTVRGAAQHWIRTQTTRLRKTP